MPELKGSKTEANLLTAFAGGVLFLIPYVLIFAMLSLIFNQYSLFP